MKFKYTVILIFSFSHLITGQSVSNDSVRYEKNYHSNLSSSISNQLLFNTTKQIESEGQYLLVRENHWVKYGRWKYYDKKGDLVLETLSPNDSIGIRYINQWQPTQNQILKNGKGKYYQRGMNRITEYGLDSTVYEIQDSLKNGFYNVWCPTELGTYYKCEIGQYIKNIQQPLRVEFYTDGEIKNISNIITDNKQGEFQSFHKNGKYSSYGYYESNRKTGCWKSWSESGILIKEENYDSGKLRGQFKEYDENGLIKTLGNYAFSIGQDTVSVFNIDTFEETIQINTTTDKSYKHGIWEYYNQDGSIQKTEEFEYGKSKR